MSMIQQLIAAVTNAEHQIDDQTMKLQSYVAEIDKTTTRVNNALGGSSQAYETRMILQLSQTKKEVEETINRLQAAKEKLQRVRMI